MRNQTFSVLFILLCSSLLFSCGTPEDKKEKYYLKAVEYITQENPQAAIVELRNAIQLDAKFADARYQLGLLYLEQGDPRNALEELSRAANLDHDNLDANLKAAELYLISRQKEESRKYVERILNKDPNYSDGLILLANLELIEGNFDKALAAITSLDEEARGSSRVRNVEGRIYGAQQQWEKAETAFIQAIEGDPDNFNNYQTLLLYYQSREDSEKGSELLSKMTEKFPDNPKTYLLLAGKYRTEGDNDKAAEALQKVIELAPDVVQHRLVLANFYQSINKFDSAEAVYIQAISDLPEYPDLKSALATLYFDQGNFEGAQTYLDEVIKSTPDHNGARLLQARFLLRDGKYGESIDLLNKLSSDYPRWSEPHFYIGLAQMKLGQIDLAVQSVGNSIELTGNNYRYRTLMAQIYLMRGEFESAKKEAAIALKLNPLNFRAALIMSRALIGAKEYDSALKLLTGMNKQVKDNTDILANLALVYLGKKDIVNAEETLEKVLNTSPGNLQAINLLLNIKFKDNLDGAETFVRSQIESNADNSDLYLILGEVLARQRKNDDALAAYKQARTLNPDNLKAYIAAGRLLSATGKKDLALAEFQSMLEQNPNSIPARMGIASIYESEGKSLEAMEQYKQILVIKGDYAPAANNLAWLISSQPDGDLGEALRLAMMAKQAFPEEAHIADTLGWVHYQRKSYTLAIPQFELALVTRPNDPIITYHLALAFQGNNETDKAKELLTSLLKRDIDFPGRDDAENLLVTLSKE